MIEVLKQALEALEQWNTPLYKRGTAIETLRQAIAELESQEPVALVIDGVLVKSALPEKYTGHLYTTPSKREWVGLTDGEAGECHSPNYVQTVANITAKLKEKNFD